MNEKVECALKNNLQVQDQDVLTCLLVLQTGIFDNPCDCTHFYQCDKDGDGDWYFQEFECPPGTVFNPEDVFCDFPENVPGCEDEGRRRK